MPKEISRLEHPRVLAEVRCKGFVLCSSRIKWLKGLYEFKNPPLMKYIRFHLKQDTLQKCDRDREFGSVSDLIPRYQQRLK